MNQLAIFAFWVLEWCVTYPIVIGVQLACIWVSLTKEDNALLESGHVKRWQRIVDRRIAMTEKWWFLFPLGILTSLAVDRVFHAFFPFLP